MMLHSKLELVRRRRCFSDRLDGIALSPDAQTLFWCPLSSRNLFGIDTALLRDFLIPESIIEENVRWIMVISRINLVELLGQEKCK